MRRIAFVSLACGLAACHGASVNNGDRFAAGKWQVEGRLESGQGSTQGTSAAGQPDTVELTAVQAANPPVSTFFSAFYRGETDWSDISFKDGKVSGSLHHGQTDVPVSGTYARDRFRIALGFGGGVDQVVEGKLVEPAK